MNTQGKMKFQAWLLIGIVFILGGVTGVSLDRLYQRQGESGRSNSPDASPRRGRASFSEALKRDLNLTDEQTASIKKVFEESRKQFHKLQSECPGFKEMREQTDGHLKEIFTAEQWQKFNELKTRREADQKAREAAPKTQ